MYARFAVLIGLSLLVAACNKNPLEVVISRCPAIAVMGDTGTVTRFNGDGYEPADIIYTASVSNMTIDCKESSSVSSTIQFDIVAGAGDALTDSTQTLDYFVVVLKDTTQIITKKIYTVSLDFNAEGSAVSPQVLANMIPEIEQARRYNYEILVGFQLTPEEVMFNMER